MNESFSYICSLSKNRSLSDVKEYIKYTRRLRNELDDREDEVSEQRKKIIRELEQRMVKETETSNLFLIRWRVKNS